MLSWALVSFNWCFYSAGRPDIQPVTSDTPHKTETIRPFCTCLDAKITCRTTNSTRTNYFTPKNNLDVWNYLFLKDISYKSSRRYMVVFPQNLSILFFNFLIENPIGDLVAMSLAELNVVDGYSKQNPETTLTVRTIVDKILKRSIKVGHHPTYTWSGISGSDFLPVITSLCNKSCSNFFLFQLMTSFVLYNTAWSFLYKGSVLNMASASFFSPKVQVPLILIWRISVLSYSFW